MEIRAATDAEAEQIVELQVERNGPSCDRGVRALFEREDVGLRRFAVAVDGKRRVACSLCLIPERLRVGEVIFGAGQVEYVATAVDREGQGLVRKVLELAHRWSVHDGNLVELIAGIPHYYRQFGYEYALPFPRLRLVSPGVDLRPPAGWSVRPATVEDIPELLRLQSAAQATADVAVLPDDAGWWRWWIGQRQEPEWWVAHRASGAIGAAGTVGPAPPGIGDAVGMVGAPAADEPAALRALLSAVDAAATVAGRPAGIEERLGVTTPLVGATHLHPRRYSVYVRIADPIAFLDALRPELDRRLATSPWQGATGALEVSTYRRAFALGCEDGRVVSVEDTAPTGRGIQVPPDKVATLLLGRYGAAGLAEREDDVLLDPDVAGVAEALFPRLTSDVSLL
jgi:hypothetical protein